METQVDKDSACSPRQTVQGIWILESGRPGSGTAFDFGCSCGEVTHILGVLICKMQLKGGFL